MQVSVLSFSRACAPVTDAHVKDGRIERDAYGALRSADLSSKDTDRSLVSA